MPVASIIGPQHIATAADSDSRTAQSSTASFSAAAFSRCSGVVPPVSWYSSCIDCASLRTRSSLSFLTFSTIPRRSSSVMGTISIPNLLRSSISFAFTEANGPGLVPIWPMRMPRKAFTVDTTARNLRKPLSNTGSSRSQFSIYENGIWYICSTLDDAKSPHCESR